MRLTLKQQWRPRPLVSVMGFMDLKTGVTVALLFAVLNKVAGVYGLIAVFTGGSFAQLSLYLYSVIALVALGWGLKAVGEEDPKRTLYFAHLFAADHVLSTAWTVFFAVIWWLYTPHDGRRQANSAAQEELMKGGAGHNLTDAQRTDAALMIWNKEKGLAAAVIIAGWTVKIYFAILIYSYAIHLRKGSYRTLPLSHQASSQYTALGSARLPADTMLGDDEEDASTDFYRLPTRGSNSGTGSGGGTSIGSFADFVAAPGRARRFRPGASALRVMTKPATGLPTAMGDEVEEELLFDSDELAGHSKLGTEESTSVSSPDDDGRQGDGPGWHQNFGRERS